MSNVRYLVAKIKVFWYATDIANIVLWQHFWPFHLSSSSWFLTLSYGHLSTRCGMSLTLVWAYCIRCCRTWRQMTQLHRASIKRTTPTFCSTSSLSLPTVHILLVCRHAYVTLMT